MIFKDKFRFGTTNYGDACFDVSWITRINTMIGAIINSKSFSKDFEKALLYYKDKIIYHLVITGLGGTDLEPGIPTKDEMFKNVEHLISCGFPAKQIVIKIDPVMPYFFVDKLNGLLHIDYLSNLKEILNFAENNNIKRIRHSFLYFHPEIYSRLSKFNVALTLPENWKYDAYEEIPLNILNKNLEYETEDIWNPYSEYLRRISNKDFKALGLDNEYKIYDELKSNKYEIEILQTPANVCPGGCIYCNYSKHNKFTIFK